MSRQFLVLVAGILWLIFPRFTRAQTAQGQPPEAVTKNASSPWPGRQLLRLRLRRHLRLRRRRLREAPQPLNLYSQSNR